MSCTTDAVCSRASVPTVPTGRAIVDPTLSSGGAATGRLDGRAAPGTPPAARAAASTCRGTSGCPEATAVPAARATATTAASPSRATPTTPCSAAPRGTRTGPTRGTGTNGTGATPWLVIGAAPVPDTERSPGHGTICDPVFAPENSGLRNGSDAYSR